MSLQEPLTLIGEIFLLICIQQILELFVDSDKKPMQMRLLNIAFIVAGLYLLLQFVFSYVLRAITSLLQFTF